MQRLTTTNILVLNMEANKDDSGTKMYSESFERKDLFIFIRYTMYIGGMHSLYLKCRFPPKFSSLGMVLELLLELFLYFVVAHICILYIITIFVNYHNGDLQLFVNCMIQAIIYWWVITMKLYFRRWQRIRLENLINFFNFNYKTRSATGFTYVTMEDSLDISNKWIKSYVCCSFIGTFLWLMLPIAYGDRSLPLHCWYPFDYKEPIVYEFMYFLQFIGQIQVAAAFSASSGLHMVLGILISGQYDVLHCSLKNILATVAIKSNKEENDLRRLYEITLSTTEEAEQYYCAKEIVCKLDTLVPIERNVETKDFRFHFRNALKNCVDHHCYLLEYLKQMEEFYHPIWFFKTGEVIFLACLVAFVSVKLTAANSTIVEMLSLAQYLLLITWELLIICYFGEIVYFNSQRTGEAILRNPWHLSVREMKFEIILLLLNSKRPFKLTAGKIFPLNTELFKSLITTAFSFFTLLQKMDQRSEEM